MKSVIAGVLGLCVSACAPLPSAPSATPGAAIARMDTVVSRLEARSPECRMTRTLDGRAVCDNRPQRQDLVIAPPATTVMAEDTARAPTAAQPNTTEPALLPGQYLVIGSFSRLENALYWANFNADFGTEVQRVSVREPAMYRVVVGPLAANVTLPMQAILSAVGVGNSWQLAVCGEPGLHDRNGCVALPAANLAATAPL